MAARFPGGPGPRTAVGYSGLGAVGGPGGVGAGALRILVEFLTQYDPKAVAALEKDVNRLEKNQAARDRRVEQNLEKQNKLQKVIKRNKEVLASVDDKDSRAIRQQVSHLETAARLETKRPIEAEKLRKVALKQLEAIRQAHGLNREDISNLINHRALQSQLTALKERQAAMTERGLMAERATLPVVEQLTRLQAARAAVIPRLGGLALGAAGFLLAGPLIGIAFSAVQGVLEKIGDTLQDIIDPARHAREAIKEVGNEILALADSESVTTLEATKRILEDLGSMADALGVGPREIERIAFLQKNNELLEKTNQLLTLSTHLQTLETEQIRKKAEQLFRADIAQGRLKIGPNIRGIPPELLARYFGLAETELNRINNEVTRMGGLLETPIQRAQRLAEAFSSVKQEVISATLEAGINASRTSLQSRIEAQITSTEAAATGTLRRIRENADATIESIQNNADARISALQNQLEALGRTGPSGRTVSLSREIDALQQMRERQAFNAQIDRLDEERFLILLRRRLELSRKEIDLSDYGGRARLVAIDAVISRLRKEAEIQNRMNQLLDIQYKLSQDIKRQEGESIRDFIERRAQENRQLLAEQTNVLRERQIDQIEDQRSALEVQLQLRENYEEKLRLIEERQYQQRLKLLQENLERSQDADREAVESKRRSLQKQIELIQRNADAQIKAVRRAEQQHSEAVQISTETRVRALREGLERQLAAIEKASEFAVDIVNAQRLEELKSAVQGAKNLSDLELVAGRVAGSSFAYGQLEASIKALGLSDARTMQILGNAQQLRSTYLARLSELSNLNRYRQQIGGRQHGGLFEISNGTYLGQDIRGGEAGRELGVVLSNKVFQALRDRERANNSIGPFYINKSEDPMRDKYELRKMIRQEIRAGLRN